MNITTHSRISVGRSDRPVLVLEGDQVNKFMSTSTLKRETTTYTEKMNNGKVIANVVLGGFCLVWSTFEQTCCVDGRAVNPFSTDKRRNFVQLPLVAWTAVDMIHVKHRVRSKPRTAHMQRTAVDVL